MAKFDKSKMYKPARRLSTLMGVLPFCDCIFIQRFVTKFRFYKSKHRYLKTTKFRIGLDVADIKCGVCDGDAVCFSDKNIKDFQKIGSVSCRLYRGDTTKVLPLVVYFHGGGFVYGNFNTADGGLRDMCHSIGCHILVIKYPLAPKYKFDTAIKACAYILQNLEINNILQNLEKDKIEYNGIILMGDSAGCSILLNVLHNCATHNLLTEQNKIVGQILLYPMVEMVYSDSGEKYPSIDQYSKGCMLTKKSLVKMTKLYLTPDISRYDMRANPIYLEHTSVPPTLIFACGYDPLRDQATQLYEKLKDIDDTSKIHIVQYDDITHGYFASFKKYIDSTIDEVLKFFYSI